MYNLVKNIDEGGIMKSFALDIPTKIYFGAGSLDNLKDIASGYGKKALLVTGRNSARKTGMLDRVVKLLKDGGVDCVVFDEVTPNPLATTVQQGADLVKSKGCDFVVGLGGGSPIDTSKAIALISCNPGNIKDYMPGGSRANAKVNQALPIIAITTTAGTGTEINSFAVVTNPDNNEKPGIGFDCMYPAVGIVDPELMVTVPKNMTAATGLDVLFHSMESFLSRGANEFTDMAAKRSIELVVAYLEKAYNNGGDVQARSKMAWANTLAGTAIQNAGTVAIHGMAHPISGHLDTTHGVALCAIGPAYLKYTWEADISRYATIARLLGQPGQDEKSLAEQSSEALVNFLKRFDMDVSLSKLGVKEEMINQFAQDALKTMSGAIGASLKDLMFEDIVNIYKMSM